MFAYLYFLLLLFWSSLVGNPPRIRNTNEITLYDIGSFGYFTPRCDYTQQRLHYHYTHTHTQVFEAVIRTQAKFEKEKTGRRKGTKTPEKSNIKKRWRHSPHIFHLPFLMYHPSFLNFYFLCFIIFLPFSSQSFISVFQLSLFSMFLCMD